jgi:flavin-dependent dehydrogenase
LARRLAGFPPPRSFARLHLYEIPVQEEKTPEFRDGAFTFDYSVVPAGIEGYLWDFPSRIGGAPYLNTGVYHRNTCDGAVARERLLEALARHVRERGADLSSARLRSYPDAEYEPDVPLAKEGVLLAGSAAGINALTGEGIWQSLAYGAIAAEAIACAHATGDWSLEDYTERVRRSPMGRDLRLSRRLAGLFYGRHFASLFAFQERNPDLRMAFIKSFAGQFDLERLSKLELVARWWRHMATYHPASR